MEGTSAKNGMQGFGAPPYLAFKRERTSIESFMLTPALWYYLSLRLWEPAFVGAEATFTTIAVWVQLGGLPIFLLLHDQGESSRGQRERREG